MHITRIRFASLLVVALVLASGTRGVRAQTPLFTETFESFTANGYVLFDGDPLYTSSIPAAGGASGGDAAGNSASNAVITSTYASIASAQGGTGYFLMSNTSCSANQPFAGEVWSTPDPVPVAPNTCYELSFYLTNRNAPFQASIQPTINGQSIGAPVTAVGSWDDGNPAHRWQRFSFQWTSGSAPDADLGLFNLQTECGGNDFGIDTIELTPCGCGEMQQCDGRVRGLFVSGGSLNTANVVRFDSANQMLLGEFVAPGTGGLGVPAGGGGDGTPTDITFGPDGRLYVLLHFGGRVLSFDGCSGALVHADFLRQPPGNPDPQLNEAHSLAFGPDGDLYVLGINPSKIQRYDGTTGAFLGTVTSYNMGNPERLAFSPSGDIYVTGNADHTVYRFTLGGAVNPASPNVPPSAVFTTFDPPGGASDLDPLAIAFAGTDVYISTEYYVGAARGSVRRFATDGTYLDDFVPENGGGLQRPFEMDFGPNGDLYVVNGGGANGVLRYSAAGVFQNGFAPDGAGGLNGPSSLAFACNCTCPAPSDVMIQKTVNNPTPKAGAAVTFTITVTNNGANTATNVVVEDLLPPGFTYVSHTVSGGGATYYPSTGGMLILNLDPEDTAVILSITAFVTSCSPVMNCASITSVDGGDPNPSNDTACVTVSPLPGSCSNVQGIKFNDLNRNGVRDPGEPTITGQTIVLKKGVVTKDTAATDGSGGYSFLNLLPATYTLTEVLQPGQIVITPASGSQPVYLAPPVSVVAREFGNYICAADQPVTCIKPPSGMVEWWPLDSIVSGSAGCAYTTGMVRNIADRVFGSPPGATACGPTSPAAVDGGIFFGGVDDYVEAADHSSLNIGAATGTSGQGDFSIDAWISTTSTATTPRIIVDKRIEQSGSVQGYSFFMQSGRLFLQLANAGVERNYASGSILVNTGAWFHVAVTVDRDSPTGIKFYVNGDLQPNTPSPALSTGTLTNTMPLRIARRSDSTNGGFWTGGIDEVELFNRVLSEPEINDIMDHGKCKRPSCHVPREVALCKNKTTVDVSSTICNYSGVPDSFTWSFAGLPTGGGCTVVPTNVTPVGGVTPVLAPGQCTTIVVKVARPAGMVAPDLACLQLTFVNSAGVCFHCKGSIRASEVSCAKPAPGSIPDVLPVTLGQPDRHLEFLLENTSGGIAVASPGTVDYRLVAVGPEGSPPNSVVSLNGLPPGTPVSGSLAIPPGATATIGVDVGYTTPDTFQVYDLVLESDTDGNGSLEESTSIGLRSIVPGAMTDACSTLLPGPGITLGWTSESRLAWNGEACSNVYNVYRATTSHFADANHDGLADDYGACFDPARTTPETYDDTDPSLSSFHAYLVSGKNAQGEGTLGTNSTGATRPNGDPCP